MIETTNAANMNIKVSSNKDDYSITVDFEFPKELTNEIIGSHLKLAIDNATHNAINSEFFETNTIEHKKEIAQAITQQIHNQISVTANETNVECAEFKVSLFGLSYVIAVK